METIIYFFIFSFLIMASVLWGLWRDRKLPAGPFSWPLVGCLFSLRQPIHRYFAKLGEKYGPLVHLRAGMLSFVVVNNSEMAREVLKIHDSEFSDRPQTTFAKNFSFGYKDMIAAAHGDSWRKLRKITMAHLFSPSKLKSTAALREEQARSAVESVHIDPACQSSSVDIDLRKLLGEYSSTVISLMLFGSKVASDVVDLIDHLADQALIVNVGELFPLLDWFDLHRVDRKMKRDILPRLQLLLGQMIDEHRREKVKAGHDFMCRDFTDVLISLQDSDGLADVHIMALLVDMISAGLDTSKASAEWAMAELIKNPDVLCKVQQEIDVAVGRARPVEESDLLNLPYLQAVMKETLRLHPSVPLGVPHLNQKEVHLSNGYMIPAKSRVLLNIWAIGRDPTKWPAPLRFDPERFMKGNFAMAGGEHFELIPFSGGRRMCAGYPLALRSIPLIVASLVQVFDWSEIPGQGICLDEDNGTLSCKLVNGLRARAHLRV